MEDVDDDFGDLYADVEVEASTAMNVAPQFSQSQHVSDDTCKQGPASNDNEDTSSGGADNDEDDDDDDDLDIVLNSYDDSVRDGDGFTIARNKTNLRSRQLEDEDNNNLGTEEFMGGRSVGNSHSLYKYLRSQSAAYGSDLTGSGSMTAAYLSPADNEFYQQMGSRSVVTQRGERFSLPRCRNILDVNIDVFEQKPWKHPGADITDYFNFGFNEDSWKLYCNQVDEYRHRVPAFEPIRLIETKGCEGGFEHEMVAHGIWGECETRQRKGQAIQVEDSIVERLSSMDVRRKIDRDSDVIQVTIVDSSIPEASNRGGVNGGDCTDHLTFSSESEDDSVEGNNLEMDIYSSKRSSSSIPVSENHEVHQISNVSGGTDEAIKTSNNTKEMAGEEDTCTTESFKAEKSPKIYCKRKPGENQYHERQSSPLYNNRNSRDSKHKHHYDDPGDKRKHGDHRYHAKCNSPVHNNGTRKYFKPKPCYENDIKSHEQTYHSVYSQRAHRVPKAKAYHEHNESFSMSDVEGAYHLHSTVGHKKRYDYERLHDFDSYYEENIPYSKSKRPSDYYEYWYERYGTLKTDRSVSSEEDGYYGEQRRYIEDNKMMARDWYLNERDYNQPFINICDDDELFFEQEYTDDIREEKFTSFSYNGRERDDFEHGYEKHVSDTRWKFRGNMSGVCSAFSELNNQSFTSRSTEGSHINNDRGHGNIMPRNCLHRRRGKSKGYDGFLGHYSQHFDRENYTIDVDGRVEMQWKEDEAILRHEDAKRCDDRTSFHFEKIARHKKLLNNLRSLKGRKYRFNKTYGERRERSCRNLLDSHLVDGEVKYSEKQKKPKLMDSYSCLSDKVAKAVVTKAIDGSLDIGDGQNLTTLVPTKHDINESRNRNRNTGFDNTRILEAMAKMEKRRTRFNEPITTTSKENVDSMMKHTVDMVLDTALNKQQRPARKRRWGGS